MSIFNKPGGGNSIFSNSNSNQNQSSSIFSKPQQGTGLFSGQQNTQQGGSIFNQGQQQGQQGGTGLFGNQGGTGLFGNQGGSNNLFGGGGNNQGGTSLFGGNQGTSTNMFAQNTQNQYSTGSYNQQGPLTGAGYPAGGQFSQVNEAQMYHLINAPEDQRKKLFQAFSPEYIRQLIALYRKQLDVTKLQRLAIGTDNPLRNEKINKAAATLNIKPQVIQLKKAIKDNVTNKLKQLKDNRDKMDTLSLDFSKKVYEKLQKYKEKLVLAMTQNKLIDEIKRQVQELDQQIKQFFKPLFNSYQNRTNYSFMDPDPFCLSVSQNILKKMTDLDNKMDELLACEGDAEEQIDTGDVILQLVEYYQNVAVALKEFSEKHHKLKHRLVQRSSHLNPGEVLKKITEKANASVSKDMEAYDLVKDIESLLKKREEKNQDRFGN